VGLGLGDLPRDACHAHWSSSKNNFVALEEVDELTFLFGAQASPDLDGLGRVLSIDPNDLGVLGRLDGVGRGGHGMSMFSALTNNRVYKIM
jgi:hypothetical protein